MGNLVVFYGKSRDIENIVAKYQEIYLANKYEIRSVNNDRGFVNCFLYTFFNKKMVIERCNLNINNYERIIIISELWFNKIPAPVIRFLEQSTGKIQKVVYVLYNDNKKDYPKEFDKMDKILNLRRENSYFVSLNKKNVNVRVYQ